MAASVITRASLVDNVTLWSAATVNSAVYDAIDSMFGGAGSYTTFEFGGAVKVTGALTPVTNDGAAIGSGTVSWADLFLASGGVVNFNNGDVTITHTTNQLTFAGADHATAPYTFSGTTNGYLFNVNNVNTGKAAIAFKTNGTTIGVIGLTGSYTGDASTNMAVFAETGYDFRVATNGSTTTKFMVDTSGNVGIGVTPGTVKLDIVGLTDVIRVASNATNATTKESKWLLRHYTNAEEDVMFAYVFSTSTSNEIYLGGGSASQNAATQISFSTAANNTTVAGTERLRITSGGNIAIGATARLYLDGVAGTGNTYISEESGDVIALTAGGAVGVRVNPQGINTGTGSQSCNSGVATTLFSVSTKGLYEVFAYYGGASAIYLSCARVMSDGAGFYRATVDNGAGLTLSLSGSNVQATQSSGGALTIQYRFVRISD